MLLCAIIIAVLILFILLYTKYEKFSTTFLDDNPEHRYDANNSIICNRLSMNECELYGCRYDSIKQSCIRPDYCGKLNPKFKTAKNEDRFKRETGCGLPLNIRNYNPECLYYSGTGRRAECTNVKPNGSCVYLNSGACVSKNRKTTACLAKASGVCKTGGCSPITIPVTHPSNTNQTFNICVNNTRKKPLCNNISNNVECNKSRYCYHDGRSCNTKKDPNKTYQTLFTTTVP